ncbi:MAG: hypothetical protein KAJ86_00395 [Alphaproteobacteria bacterium]|nr:hypothetical protein [Alphaproteobacteria bacterium]
MSILKEFTKNATGEDISKDITTGEDISGIVAATKASNITNQQNKIIRQLSDKTEFSYGEEVNTISLDPDLS